MKLSKKLVAGLVCTTMFATMSITGCGKTQQPAPQQPQQQEQQQEQQPSAGMANPTKEYKSLDEINALNGGGLIKVFDDATDEKFFGTEFDGITMAEYQFTKGEQVYTFRSAPTMKDISGIYTNEGGTAFQDMAAFKGMQERYTEEYFMGRWFAGDMQYTLTTTHSDKEEESNKQQEAFDKLVPAVCEATGGDTNSEYDVNADYRLPEDQEKDQQAGMANPVQQMSESDMTQATGIDLPLPKEATDVTYSVINAGDQKIAQADFTLNGKKMYLRAVFTQLTKIVPDANDKEFDPSVGDMSGLNYTWDAGGTNLVQNREAIVNVTKKGQGYIAWLDVVPGILYNLCMTEGADMDTLVNTANEIFVPMQGEA